MSGRAGLWKPHILRVKTSERSGRGEEVRHTCKRAVAPDVVSDEACGEHEQNHEQLGPGETATLHLYLQILQRRRVRARLHVYNRA